MKVRQGELDLRVKGWGGVRDKAGRKRSRMLVGEREGAPHVERPEVVARFPLHVTLRTVVGVRHMRHFEGYLALRRAAQVVAKRDGFRLLHASLQENHVHLVVEADDKKALAKGVRAFEVSFAMNLNRRIKMRDGKGRRGRVFADRYHARPLQTPTEVRNAIRYVLRGSTRIPIEELPVSAPMSWLMRRVHRQIERSRQDWVYDRLLPDELAWRSVVSSTS